MGIIVYIATGVRNNVNIDSKGNITMNNEIPAMIDPLSYYWAQPDRSEICVDDKNALMNKESLDKLHDYSGSIPTGVYMGKMWKRFEKTAWFLVWYGECGQPGRCSVNYREIILA